MEIKHELFVLTPMHGTRKIFTVLQALDVLRTYLCRSHQYSGVHRNHEDGVSNGLIESK